MALSATESREGEREGDKASEVRDTLPLLDAADKLGVVDAGRERTGGGASPGRVNPGGGERPGGGPSPA